MLNLRFARNPYVTVKMWKSFLALALKSTYRSITKEHNNPTVISDFRYFLYFLTSKFAICKYSLRDGNSRRLLSNSGIQNRCNSIIKSYKACHNQNSEASVIRVNEAEDLSYLYKKVHYISVSKINIYLFFC